MSENLKSWKREYEQNKTCTYKEQREREREREKHIERQTRVNSLKQNIWIFMSRPLPDRIALWARNSLPATQRVTSLEADLSNSWPRSSLRRHSGTLTGEQLDCPEIFTVSPTTLTCATREKNSFKEGRKRFI